MIKIERTKILSKNRAKTLFNSAKKRIERFLSILKILKIQTIQRDKKNPGQKKKQKSDSRESVRPSE